MTAALLNVNREYVAISRLGTFQTPRGRACRYWFFLISVTTRWIRPIPYLNSGTCSCFLMDMVLEIFFRKTWDFTCKSTWICWRLYFFLGKFTSCGIYNWGNINIYIYIDIIYIYVCVCFFFGGVLKKIQEHFYSSQPQRSSRNCADRRLRESCGRGEGIQLQLSLLCSWLVENQRWYPLVNCHITMENHHF